MENKELQVFNFESKEAPMDTRWIEAYAMKDLDYTKEDLDYDFYCEDLEDLKSCKNCTKTSCEQHPAFEYPDEE